MSNMTIRAFHGVQKNKKILEFCMEYNNMCISVKDNYIDVTIILSTLKAQLNSRNIQIRKNTKIIILRTHLEY